MESRRPSVPPTVSRPSASGRDNEVQASATGKESAPASDVSSREAEFRSKSVTPRA